MDSYQPQQNKEKEIKNPQIGDQNIMGSEMHDRDYLNDVLATEKYLTECFNTFIREASHLSLYGDLNRILAETHQCSREIFNLMFKKGCTLQGAERKEIEQMYQQFTNYRSQFPLENITQ